MYIALAIVVVSSLGFSTAGIIAAFSAVALAVALALKDSLGSLANGVILIFTKPFKKGDFIAVDGMEGTVQDIRLFNTKILTPNNEEIIIPNSEVLGNKLINYTTMPLRRVVIAFPVPYDSDIDAVREIILGCATAHPLAVASPAPAVVLDAYDSSAVRLSVRVWTLNENYWTVTNELKEILFNTLRDKGIEIPLRPPRRTAHRRRREKGMNFCILTEPAVTFGNRLFLEYLLYAAIIVIGHRPPAPSAQVRKASQARRTV